MIHAKDAQKKGQCCPIFCALRLSNNHPLSENIPACHP
ncbi:hypothetical protein D3OALGB2SA_1094 [Olavius algarvensis associated proteobacterium Delta 3]|nr:hypothetical protein D3OALGB2SA_1094 [Olavius algarvensis associated proteobacterium Delta 3]